MITEHFRAALKQVPFRPFVLHLADGRGIPVLHPEWAAAAPTSRTSVVWQPDGGMNLVDMLLVTDIEFKDLNDVPDARAG
jgi:hypothetical protein